MEKEKWENAFMGVITAVVIVVFLGWLLKIASPIDNSVDYYDVCGASRGC